MTDDSVLAGLLAQSCRASWPCMIAYLGPGGVVSAVGALLAVIAGVLVAILGFIWYPIRRVVRKLREKRKDGDRREE